MNDIEVIKLDNGLRVYFYIDKRRHSTLFQHVTLFGGKTKDFMVDGKEYHMQDGIAHILEHYIVEENAKGNFLKLLGEKQMATNASTYFDMTRFYFEAVEDVEFGIRTMIEGIYSPIFEEERLERVKKPILQEIRGKMDSKFFHSNQAMFDSCFQKLKVRGIGGTLEEISGTTLSDVVTCFEAFYQPENQFIVVAGNFDKDSVLKTIKDCYSKIDIKKKDVSLISVKEPKKVASKRSVVKFPTGEEYVEVTYKVNLKKFSNIDRLKLDFYLHWFFDMSFGVSSPLYRKLVQDQVITTALSCGDFTIDDYVLISVGSYTKKKDALENSIKEVFKKLDSFDKEIFEIDKRDSIIKIVLRGESLSATIMPFVDNIVSFDYPYLDKVKDIEDLTYDDFVEMIKSLDFSENVVVTIEDKNI